MPTTTLPVTVAATRRARAGSGEGLEQWAAQLCATAARTSGGVRCRVERSRRAGSVAVTVVLTFASAADAHSWESSAERSALVAEGDTLTHGGAAVPALLPGGPMAPRWRTALVVWAGLFPFALLLNVVAGPALAEVPVLPRTILTTAVLVPLAVYLGIPAVTRLLARGGSRRS